jgi:hypothetical protein
MRGLILAVALMLAATGCFRHEYTYPDPPERRAQVWQWHHHLLWGLVNISPSVHLERICPQGVARIENWLGPGQAIISWLTGGIYTPTTVRVYCARAPGPGEATGNDLEGIAVRVEMDAQTIARLREDFPDLEARVAALQRDLSEPEAIPPAMRTALLPPAPLSDR